jgi:hypothetical protein
MIELSGDEMVPLFKQHLKVLRQGRNAIWAQVTASRKTIEQSRALLVQIDEQINRIERELGWLGADRNWTRPPEVDANFVVKGQRVCCAKSEFSFDLRGLGLFSSPRIRLQRVRCRADQTPGQA